MFVCAMFKMYASYKGVGRKFSRSGGWGEGSNEKKDRKFAKIPKNSTN